MNKISKKFLPLLLPVLFLTCVTAPRGTDIIDGPDGKLPSGVEKLVLMNPSGNNPKWAGAELSQEQYMEYIKQFLPQEAADALSENSAVSRKVLAGILGNVLGGTSSNYPSDVNQSEWYAQGAAVSCDYRLFGTYTTNFRLNPDSGISRLDAARLAVRLYAAITGIDEYRVDPGLPCGITDLLHFSVEKQWYAYSAMYNGFMGEASSGKFEPLQDLTGGEAAQLLYNIVERGKSEGNEYAATAEKFEKNYSFIPHMKNLPVAEYIDTLDINNIGTRDEQKLAVSIQGLVNRQEVKILYRDVYNSYMYDYLIEKNYIKGTDETFTNVMDIVRKYKDFARGAVVVDPANPYTINTAETIAGVENRIIIIPEMIPAIREMGFTDIRDLRDYKLQTLYEAQRWLYNNYWMFTRRDSIHSAGTTVQYDLDRDLMIQMRIPSIFIPRQGECKDYLLQYQLIEAILIRMPYNIPIIGFPPAHNFDTNDLVGLNEYDGVLFVSQYGKFYFPQNWVGNLSYWSALTVPEETRKFNTRLNVPKLVYDPDVKYVCINMCDSGDAASYIQYGLYQFQWSDTERGKVPFSICYGYGHYDMLPTYTEYFAGTQGDYDYMFAAGSALSYNIPFSNNFGASFSNIKTRSEGYASIPIVDDDNIVYPSRDFINRDHYTKLNIMMGKTGLSSQMVYSHGGIFWQPEDYDYVNTYHTGLSNMTSIMADLLRSVPRNQVNPSVYTLADGKPMFHAITGYNPHDTRLFISGKTDEEARRYDEFAVNWFVREIVNSTTNDGTSNLYHCAVYSWQINFRRVRMIIEKIHAEHPGKYEFVTIGQLEDLYYQSMERR